MLTRDQGNQGPYPVGRNRVWTTGNHLPVMYTSIESRKRATYSFSLWKGINCIPQRLNFSINYLIRTMCLLRGAPWPIWLQIVCCFWQRKVEILNIVSDESELGTRAPDDVGFQARKDEVENGRLSRRSKTSNMMIRFFPGLLSDSHLISIELHDRFLDYGFWAISQSGQQ